MYLWNDGKFDYWLAESSGPKAGDNFELKLRSGIKWSDGAAFTAKDVYTTFNVGRLENFTLWQYVDKMEIANDHDVNFHFSRPSSLARAAAPPRAASGPTPVRRRLQGDRRTCSPRARRPPTRSGETFAPR